MTLRPIEKQDSDVEAPLLVVANTHIHFDPKYSDVKVIQVHMLLESIQEQKKQYLERNEDCRVVVCGDFNSLPNSGVYDLLRSVRSGCLVSRLRFCCTCSESFINEGHEDLLGFTYSSYSCEGLRHSLNLQSAYCAVLGRELDFSNYTPAFKGVIDYIWVDDKLVVEAVMEGITKSDGMI